MEEEAEAEEEEAREEGEEEEEEEEEVMSEVHLGIHPSIHSLISVFTISHQPLPFDRVSSFQKFNSMSQGVGEDNLTTQPVIVDEMGDLDLPRRDRHNWQYDGFKERDNIFVHHKLTTSIPHVGLQVWKGAFLLSDFLIHKMRTTVEFDNVKAIELGAGTDKGISVLENCYRNAILNLHYYERDEQKIQVRELDWCGLWPPNSATSHSYSQKFPYSWTNSDIEEIDDVSLLLAADVIYSDQSTTAFFSIVQKLMPPVSNKVLLLALEKRYNFTINDLDVVAHGYTHFRSFIKDITVHGLHWNCEQTSQSGGTLYGKKLEVDQIPQYIEQYERTPDLELWEIRNL